MLTSMAGTWAVLIPSKLWEGNYGEPSLRRFTLMVVGLGVGMLACVAADALLVDLRPATGLPHPTLSSFGAGFCAADGRPLMMSYVACFGTLFFLIRWWRQTNPFL